MQITINIDPNFPRWLKRVAMYAGVPALLVVAGSVYADVSVPNHFNGTDLLSANKMNENFKAVADAVNQASPPGSIIAYGGATPPTGWLTCDGSSLDGNQAQYAALFAAIGTNFGGNANAKQFNLPDFRGRFLRGWDHGQGRDPDAVSRSTSAAGGNANDAVGSLEADAFKSHDHTSGTESVPSGTSGLLYMNNVQGGMSLRMEAGGACVRTTTNQPSGGGAATHTHSIGQSGGSETRPANVYVNYIIKL
jgi:microcystin-dependent protein